ncbi:hypothetical protein I4U23_019914 [Adineta vaga]|nr:hypothetical protein I4U23_019914 [Adineta vaga]
MKLLFLNRYEKQRTDNATPIQISKNPHGSLCQAMTMRNALLKEQHNADILNDHDTSSSWKQSLKNQIVTLGKRMTMNIIQQQQILPIYHLKDELIKAIHNHQITIIVGETEGEYTSRGCIVCPQLHRVADEVGCTIRFEVDPNLKQYSVVMLDEAHERTVHTDVLFGLMKQVVQNPREKEPENDYFDASIVTIMQIHLSQPPGDVLVFLTAQEETDITCEILYDRIKALGSDLSELIILPVYSTLPNELQTRILDPTPTGSRKVIFASNIADTSLTVDGIYYIIDSGFVKQKIYNRRSGVKRTNALSTVLILKAMGINDLLTFDFMDPSSNDVDHLTLLAVYTAWEEYNDSDVWCNENFIQARSLVRARQIRQQLLRIMQQNGLQVVSCGINLYLGYRRLVDNQFFYIHPSNSLYYQHPQGLSYYELVCTRKEYIRDVCAINPKSLLKYATKLSTMKMKEPLENRYERSNS